MGMGRKGKVSFNCHDSSIRTSIVRGRERGVRVRVHDGLEPSSRATTTSSPPSTCARPYNASRASSSAVRFARERRASANWPRIINTNTNEKKKKGSPKAACSPATARTTLSMRTFLRDQRTIWLCQSKSQRSSPTKKKRGGGGKGAHQWKDSPWRPRPPCRVTHCYPRAQAYPPSRPRAHYQ